MKQQKRWTLLIAVLTLSVLACAPCGLGNFLERTQAAVMPDETVVAEVEAVVEAAQEAAETSQDSAENQAASQSETTGDEQADQAAAEDSANVEALNLPNNLQDSLAKFDSYQLEYQIEAETTEKAVKATIQLERTTNAQHIVMQSEGDAAQLGNFDRVELFVVTRDGQTTMYMQNPLDQSWTAITANSMDEAFGMLPLSLDSFGLFPQQGRPVEEVDVNGVPTTHYAFSEKDFPDTGPGVEEAQGDVWVNEEMALVMKAIMRVKGSELSLGDQPFQFASYTITYEVKKFNDPSIVITVPDAALNSAPMTIPGSSTDPDQIDFPTPPGANIELAISGMLNFTVDKSVAEVWEFYQQNLGNDNWQVTLETPTNIMATYNGGDKPVQLMIIEEDNVSRVIINTE